MWNRRGDLTGHYDIRHFKDVVDYDTRLDTLKHMVRAWLQTTAKEGIETWIAHGTLLGWWWNAEMLPWDWDLDVQVHVDTLKMLGAKYNQTTHLYKSEDGTVEREYFLDVNPWIWERVRGDGHNIIDARWIDVRNGLYIDITGISETEPEKFPGILHCKNYHRYHYDDIWPLRDTIFEGVPAKIPYNFDAILIKEYNTKALTVTEYEGHRWNVQKKVWELARDVPTGAQGEIEHSKPRIPEKYSTVETGGFFHNIYRLIHWWE
ncbi:LicD family-domain-containing protein [Sphaerosporella brunnea]|uniref:LicD family-domain-containing protein n=1 Tax=Sphaerosporella brunnea TaxID=1250544 RepID=A0A5J5F5B0_9PEZI|nr:LicD family-domain-containing protein [Sphaerosporella brunnea]KAA8911788.1 LicD family-domain-containing protein [Sphaerosporella brunnea]